MNLFIFLNFCWVLSVFGYDYSSSSKGVYGYGGYGGYTSGRYPSCSDITSPSRCQNQKCPGIGNHCKWNGRNRCTCQEGSCSDYKTDCESYSCPYTGNECVYNENIYACSCQPQIQTYATPTTTNTYTEPIYQQDPLPGCQKSADTNGFVNLTPFDDAKYPILFNFRYLGVNYDRLFLTSNGVINFIEQPAYLSAARCGSANIGPLMAFFWADWFSPTPPGLIKYKITSDPYDLESAEKYIKLGWPSEYEYLKLTQALIIRFEEITWYDAPAPSATCPGQLLRNTIQVTLATNGCREHFVIIEYERIDWANVILSCGCYGWMGDRVVTQFDSGSKVWPISSNSCTAKLVNLANESNVRVPGYFVFKVGEAEVIEPTPSSDVSASTGEAEGAAAESLNESAPQSSFLKE